MSNPHIGSAAGRTITTLIVVSTLGALAVTGFGLAQQEWPEVLPFWRHGATPGYLGFMACSALVIGLARITLGVSHVASTVLLVLAMALVDSSLAPLLAVTYWLAACWSLGFFVIKALCPQGPPAGELARLLAGAGLWATAGSMSAHFEVNTPWVWAIALGLPIVAARAPLIERVRSLVGRTLQRRHDRRLSVERSLLGAFVLTYFAFALLPELSHDPLALHLFVPSYVEANQAWNFDPSRYVWTLMPLLADWAYTIVYLLGGEAAAKLVNLAFLLACAQLVRHLVQTLGGTDRGADWGALIFISTPLTFFLGSALYVEPFWSAYLLAGALFTFRIMLGHDDRSSQLMLVALFLAFAAAAKAVALVVLPIIFALLIPSVPALLGKGNRLATCRAAGLFVAIAAIPYLIAWLISGNPVFPFFNAVFESPFYPAENFQNRAFVAELKWDLPYQLVYFAQKFTSGMTGGVGAGGFQWVLLLVPSTLAALAFRDWKAAVLAAVCLLSLLVVFEFQAFLRYAFPAFLLLSALVGLVMSKCAASGRTLRWTMAGLAALTLGLNALFLGSASPNYKDVPVLEVFDPQGEDRIVRQREPIRKAVELVNQLNESRSPVIFLAPPLAAGLASDALFVNWYNLAFERELRSAPDTDAFARLVRKHSARYLILDSRWRRHQERLLAWVDWGFHIVGRFGPVSVHKLDDAIFFSEELLAGTTELSSPPWLVREGADPREDGSVLVTVSAPITQSAPVEAGRSYLNRVTAKCADQPARGRLQVIWRSADREMLGTEIFSFPCRTIWATESQEVVAPQGAATAVVFGTGHAAQPIHLAEISFRGSGS